MILRPRTEPRVFGCSFTHVRKVIRHGYSTSNLAPPDALAGVSAPSFSPRWLSDVKKRIGKCISFGLNARQTEETGALLRIIAKDWKELLASSEGFLTGEGRQGLERQAVVWGEMVLPPASTRRMSLK